MLDNYNQIHGYTVDGKLFVKRMDAVEYMQTQGFTFEEAFAYLALLYGERFPNFNRKDWALYG